jgi:hypothetical protein
MQDPDLLKPGTGVPPFCSRIWRKTGPFSPWREKIRNLRECTWVTAGKAKGLILLGDEASEDPGSGEVAAWLEGFVTELPIEWIPAGAPFWVISRT